MTTDRHDRDDEEEVELELPEDLVEDLDRIAAAIGKTREQIIREILEDEFAKHEAGGGAPEAAEQA